MMTLTRRFVVLTALLFWQGGFLFYASVVVPIGQEVLGSHRRQGFITQRVTNYLNLSGAIALVPLAWDVAAGRDSTTRRRRLRWLMWAGMVACLAVLAWLHPRLDNLLEETSQALVDHAAFRTMHRWYLWISTVQWGMGVVYGALMLCAWRAEDRQTAE
jgi:hypothetical protein